jgi:hypothetical protein
MAAVAAVPDRCVPLVVGPVGAWGFQLVVVVVVLLVLVALVVLLLVALLAVLVPLVLARWRLARSMELALGHGAGRLGILPVVVALLVATRGLPLVVFAC